MNKIVWAVAAALPCLLAGCQKEMPKPVEPPPTVKPDESTVVADVEPITEPQKASLLEALKARLPKLKKVAPQVAAGSEWFQAINEELIVDKNHCMAEDGTSVPDDQCHLYVVEPVAQGQAASPVRVLRIGQISKQKYWAFIRTDSDTEQFMFCPQLEVTEPFVIGGYCTFRPHEDQGKHWVYFIVSYAETTGKFRSVNFEFRNKYWDRTRGGAVHNGEGHGGDS